MYLLHESEVPGPNDFQARRVGRRPVIVARGEDASVSAVFNRCTHRGTLLCPLEHGSAARFQCAYHGWTFTNDGALRGYPFPSGYEGVDRSELGLGKVARVASYKGFVFGSMAEDGPTLEEHLGAAAEAIDALCLTSPEGEVEIKTSAGTRKAKISEGFADVSGSAVVVMVTSCAFADGAKR